MTVITPELKLYQPNTKHRFGSKALGLFLLLAILSFSFTPQSPPPPSPSDVTNFQFKGLFCWKFIQSTEWPSDYQSGSFVIGIYGESPIQQVLEDKYKGKALGHQSVEIKKISSTSSMGKVHLLYVPAERSKDLGKILRALQEQNQSTMIITEEEGLLTQGAVFNFVVDGNRVRFEINKRNAEKFHLKISSSLTDLAERVVE